MSLFYVDASAIAKLVIDEIGSAALRIELLGHRLVTSRVAVVEVSKAVQRVGSPADPGPAFDRISFLELDASVAATAAEVGGPLLRALDAIHLASALALGDELTGFVTYDVRQAAVARAAGIEVLSPGANAN